jgi:hypothetical protein
MISWQRTIYFLGLAVVEATPAALLLLLAGARGAWGLLCLVVLAGALADWLAQRWLSPEQQRPARLLAAALTALWAVKGYAGAGWGLLAGWGLALTTLFAPAAPHAWPAYLLFVAALFAFWRGLQLAGHDSTSLRKLFTRAALALMLIVGLGLLWQGSSSSAPTALATMMVLAFFAMGLLVLALASLAEQYDTRLRRLGWRGFLILGGAIGLVLVPGLLLASRFGETTAQILRAALGVLVIGVALIFLPPLLILEAALRWLFELIDLEGFAHQLALRQQFQQQQQQQALETLHFLPPWLEMLVQVFLALLPILILAALIVLLRRRARPVGDRGEERESLWSWNGLASDLRDLLARLRRSSGQDEGLRAALARLRGADPISRIRRSYIRLLLAGEAHQHPRTPSQTPREYQPTAEAMLPTATVPITRLTDAYERARYHPLSATAADAEAAEQAWSEIERIDRAP